MKHSTFFPLLYCLNLIETVEDDKSSKPCLSRRSLTTCECVQFDEGHPRISMHPLDVLKEIFGNYVLFCKKSIYQ